MICNKCGNEIKHDTAVFCNKCGAKLNSDVVNSEVPSKEAEKELEKAAEKAPEKGSEKTAEKATTGEGEKSVTEETKEKKESKSRGLIIGLCIGSGVLLIALIVCVCVLVLSWNNKNESTNETSEKTQEDLAEASAKAETSDNDEATDNVNKKDEKEEKTEKEESSEKDPLEANKTVIFAGEKARDDKETKELVNFFMEKSKTDSDNILAVSCSDFDANGEYEAFIFEGEKNEGDDIFAYSGRVWFTDGKSIQDLGESSTGGWSCIDEYIDFNERKFYSASEAYATGSVSKIWSVYEGEVRETNISGLGDVEKTGDYSMSVMVSAYDSMYDKFNDMWLGHTWKNYYFYYDSSDDMIKEYGGVAINPEELDDICNENLEQLFEEKGYYFIDAFLRENGILNINYLTCKEDTFEVTFYNATYDTVKKSFIPAFEGNESSFEGSNTGGYYEKCLFEDIATSPKRDSYENTILMTVYSIEYYCPMGEDRIFIFGIDSDARNGFTKRVAYADRSTMGYSGEPEDGRTPLEWLNWLSRPDEDMVLSGQTIAGVFDFDITGAHIDNINGQYWWD